MRLYKNNDGLWAGTQASAKKLLGKDYTEVNVPVDKTNLLEFLNLNQVGAGRQTDSSVDVGEDVPQKAIHYFAWSYDKLLRGDIKEAKEMMHIALSMTKEGDANE